MTMRVEDIILSPKGLEEQENRICFFEDSLKNLSYGKLSFNEEKVLLIVPPPSDRYYIYLNHLFRSENYQEYSLFVMPAIH